MIDVITSKILLSTILDNTILKTLLELLTKQLSKY